SDWAAGLSLPSGATAFFNITATHDGIGVRPVADILPPAQIDALVQGTLERGGQVSSRTLPDGGKAPYELNITFFDALLPPGADPAAPESLDRYIAAQAVALSLAGVPAIYFHNLFGTRNDAAGFAGTGRARTLNRRRFERAELDALLADGNGRERRIFDRYTALLRLWRTQPAFHPAAPQRVLAVDPAVFAVLRGEGTAEAVLALHNLSASPCRVTLPKDLAAGPWTDLPTGDRFADGAAIELPPYRLLWLRRPWPV
ncbi:MAG: sugar phosphorylase, partial [Inquilinus sp.]|nr:sugar phosphorylase [Inquilinus sp.]